MKMTKENFDAFRKAFAEAVKDLEEKFDVKVQLEKINYSDSYFNAKLTVTNVGEDGTPVNKMTEQEFGMLCFAVDAKPEWYNAVFFSHGVEYRVVGINTRKRRYPIELVETKTGKRVNCTPDMVAYNYRP